jgi:rhodanese-related sulfurtransferase
MTKEEFIKEVTDGLLPPPAYFPLNVMLNKQGYEDVSKVLERGQTSYSPNEFESAAQESGVIVLDVRHQDEFVKGHIPGSIFIGIDGGFAPWVGAILKDIERPILLVSPQDRIEEVITRLSRVGFDNVLGYLAGGFDAWKDAGKEYDTVESITADEFARNMAAEERYVVDVRKESEYLSEHVINAVNAPLDELEANFDKFKKEGSNFVHCAGGYRSVIASSILKANGIHNIVDVKGGFGAIKKTDVNVSAYVCPTTL